MEGLLIDKIKEIPKLNEEDIKQLFEQESRDLEITKSLLNLLYNIIVVDSVPHTVVQRRYFDSHADLVSQLLDRKVKVYIKRQLLLENISLVIHIAASCPSVAGL